MSDSTKWPCIGSVHTNALNLCSFKFSELAMVLLSSAYLSFINAFSNTIELHIPLLCNVMKIIFVVVFPFRIALKEPFGVKYGLLLIPDNRKEETEEK